MRVWTLLLSLGLALTAVSAAAAPAKDVAHVDYPWELRVHYSFPSKGMTLDYDEGYARMRERVGEDKVLTDELSWAIAFGDGAVWTCRDLSTAKTVREMHSDPQLGSGVAYTTTFPEKSGVVVRYVATVYDTRPFITLQLQVQNNGTAPLKISALDPVVTGAGGIASLSPESRLTQRAITSVAGYPVYDTREDADVVIFSDAPTQALLAFVVFPEGKASSGAKFEQQGSAWHGRISSKFAPAITLAPGQTLASDRVGLIHGPGNRSDIDTYYSWAMSAIAPPKENRKGPSSWITISDNQGLSELLNDARVWSGSGVKHALIPANWESQPGSMKGAAPRYPGNMKSAAGDIKDAGATPGISIDPLAVDDGPSDAVLRSPDGQLWLNPAAPSAQEFAKKRYAKLADWGYGFLVVAPSTIPDDVLSGFNITRTEAYQLGVNLVEDASGTAFVYPASAAKLRGARSEWLQAASALGRMGEYNVGLSPITLDAGGLGNLDPETLNAIRLWRGPIELQGRAQNDGAAALGRLLQLPRLDARPLDIDRAEPLLWQVDFKDQQSQVVGASVLAFSGAESLETSDISQGKVALRLWNPTTGNFATDTESVAPAAGLNLYGAGSQEGHPTLLSAMDPDTKHIARVKYVEWDAPKKTLTVAFVGPDSGKVDVVVSAPAPWVLSSAEVGGKKARAQEEAGKVTLSLDGAGQFSLKFK